VERREMHTELWLESNRQFRKLKCRCEYNIKMDLEKHNGRVWAGMIFLRAGAVHTAGHTGSIKGEELFEKLSGY
jgi:hypothetical protein